MGSTYYMLCICCCLALLISVCQSSVIPAIHTVPTVGVSPTYTTVGTPLVGGAVPAIVTAASNQVIARNYNRWYVPVPTTTYTYPTYPTTTTYYKYPSTWPYGYGYPSTYGYGYSYGGLWR